MSIPFEKFQEIELRVARIIEAEEVEGSEKLLKLQVDLGEETRQILAGIAKHYNPEELVGKQIVIVANLEPRKMMGLESQGMILAADSSEKPILISPWEEVSSGTRLR